MKRIDLATVMALAVFMSGCGATHAAAVLSELPLDAVSSTPQICLPGCGLVEDVVLPEEDIECLHWQSGGVVFGPEVKGTIGMIPIDFDCFTADKVSELNAEAKRQGCPIQFEFFQEAGILKVSHK